MKSPVPIFDCHGHIGVHPDFPACKYTPDEMKKMVVPEQLVKPDEWFTQEVIAVGNHIVIKVNGKTAIDFVDEKNRHTKGHLAIQHLNPATVIQVRKVEVKRLPATG